MFGFLGDRVTGPDDMEGSDVVGRDGVIDDEPKRDLVRFPRVPIDVDQPSESGQGQPR